MPFRPTGLGYNTFEMIARVRTRWQAILDHPILQLELRRIRRRRWWPGRRFFLFYPVLMGAVLGCGTALVLTALLDKLSAPVSASGTQLAALITGLPVICPAIAASSILAFVLPWIAPAFTATTIARERELGTLNLLRATLLTERSIVLGKLGGCLAQLWPGILALALLMPFQLLIVMGGGLMGSPYMLGSLAMTAESGAEWAWGSLLLTAVVELFRPWSDLALHATIGIFISTLVRSPGLAVAATYGTIIGVRMILYLAASLLGIVLMTIPSVILEASGAVTSEFVMNVASMMSSLTALAVVLIEFVGAALLVWAAVWWLKRT